MKNIAFLIPSLTSGGAEKLTLTIAEKLAENDRVYLILLEKEVDFEITNRRITLIKLSQISTYATVLKLLFSGFYMHKLAKIITKYKINTVYSVMERANFINLITSKINKNYTPILSVHAAPNLSFKERGAIKRYFIQYLYTHIPPNIKIIAVSKGIKKELKTLYDIDNISMIYNPINLTEIRKKALIKQNIINDNDKFKLVTVARLTEEKGLIYLLRAFAKIKPEIREKMNLLIIGDGILRQSLEQESIKLGLNQVFFLGYQQNPYSLMTQCDLFVLPSLHEGFGIAIVEAMALGLAVISSNCYHGPEEILRNEGNNYGVLVDVHQSKKQFVLDLAAAIEQIYADDDRRLQYQQSSKKRAMDFDIERIIKDYRKIL